MEPTPKMKRIRERYEKRYKNMNKEQKQVLATKMENFIDKKMKSFEKNFLDRNKNIDPNNLTKAQIKQVEKVGISYLEKTLLPKVAKMVRQEEKKAIKQKPQFVQQGIKNRREREKQEQLKKKAGK
jgi:hypothetical protein